MQFPRTALVVILLFQTLAVAPTAAQGTVQWPAETLPLCTVNERSAATFADGTNAGAVYRPVGHGPFPAILHLVGVAGYTGPTAIAGDPMYGDYVILSWGGLAGGGIPPSSSLLSTRVAVLAQLVACLQSLTDVIPDRIGAVGFYEAGYYASLLATHPSVAAVVNWEGLDPDSATLRGLNPDGAAPTLLLAPGADDAAIREGAQQALAFLRGELGAPTNTAMDPRPPLPGSSSAVTVRPTSPAATGPFRVGSITRNLARRGERGEERPLSSRITYPAAAGTSAPPDRSEAPYPVLFLSHGSGGGNGLPGAYSELAQHLASHGFVVVAPGFSDGVRECADCPWTGSAAAVVAQGQAANARFADLDFLAYEMERLQREDPLLRGFLDTSRMGLIGHSFGGVTSLYILEHDARFRAAVALGPGAAPGFKYRMINGLRDLFAPMMVVAGGQDIEAPGEEMETWWDRGAGADYPRWLVFFPHGNHYYLYGTQCPASSPDCGPSYPYVALPFEQAAPHLYRWTTAFLLKYVAGNDIYGAWLDPTFEDTDPEVRVATTSLF